MDFEGATRARLLNDARVASVVWTNGTKKAIYWVERPQQDSTPAAVLEKVGGSRDQHLKGFDDLRPTRIQLNSFALSFDLARSLLEAMIDALVPEGVSNGIRFNRAIIDGEPVTGGEQGTTNFIHHHHVDLIMWWQTA